MNRAIQSAICVLFVLAIAGTSHAQDDQGLRPISNCTTISTPGSYFVTNNITATPSNIIPVPGSSGFACILIEADFVTLNLAGFAITASNLGSTYAYGIATDFADHSNIYLHSGTVAHFSGIGVALFGNGHTVEHIRAKNNASGIVVQNFTVGGPTGYRIVGNTAISNGKIGIFVACPAVVLENTADGNGPRPGLTGVQIVETVSDSTRPCTNAANSPNIT